MDSLLVQLHFTIRQNISNYEIEDWKLTFELDKKIYKIKDAIIESHVNNVYYINNCIRNSSIKAGKSVSFKLSVSNSTYFGKEVLPINEVLMQVIEEATDDETGDNTGDNTGDETGDDTEDETGDNTGDITEEELKAALDWDNEMIRADSENVIAARNQVNNVVKVALIDSGVDYSREINVVERKNFIPGYDEEELNPLFDDLTGHGTAAAALIASNSSIQNEEDDIDETGEEDEEDIDEEFNYDFSYLTDSDKLVLTPELDEEAAALFNDDNSATTDMSDDEAYEDMDNEEDIAVEDRDNDANATDEYANPEEAETDTSNDEMNVLEKLMSRKFDGVNPNTEIYSARVLDSNNEAPISRVIEAIDWAIEKNVNIININWGTEEDNNELHEAIKKAYKNNILIIAAAGNGENIQYPAKYEEVMAVGSVKYTGEKADESATGEEMEVVAPGEDICSYGPFGILATYSGTSMAAPQVAGLASILWQKDITKSNEFIRQLIDSTANNLGDKNIFGFGLIDCERAVSQYDEFARTYVEKNTVEENVNDAIEEEAPAENREEDEAFDENTVEGSWSGDDHKALLDYLDENEPFLDCLKIMRKGVTWADTDKSGLKGMKSYPGFHGFYKYKDKDKNNNTIYSDYVAAYIYI